MNGAIYYIEKLVDYDLTSNFAINIPWQEVIWGRTGRKLPRLTYKPSIPELFELIPEMTEVIATLCNNLQRPSIKLHGCWLNYYRNGHDYTPFHRDSYDADIVLISFGATRTFAIKDNNGTATGLPLNNGDVLIFDKEFDANHKHALLKETKVTEPRVSIVLFINL